jgi:hypothetical protein
MGGMVGSRVRSNYTKIHVEVELQLKSPYISITRTTSENPCNFNVTSATWIHYCNSGSFLADDSDLLDFCVLSTNMLISSCQRSGEMVGRTPSAVLAGEVSVLAHPPP